VCLDHLHRLQFPDVTVQQLFKQSAIIRLLPLRSDDLLQSKLDGFEFEIFGAVFGKDLALSNNLIDLVDAPHLLLVVLFGHLGDCSHSLTEVELHLFLLTHL
jgi:hypothetical protein